MESLAELRNELTPSVLVALIWILVGKVGEALKAKNGFRTVTGDELPLTNELAGMTPLPILPAEEMAPPSALAALKVTCLAIPSAPS